MIKRILLNLCLLGMAMPVQARVVEKQIGSEGIKKGSALIMGTLLGFGVKKLVTAFKKEVTPGQVKTYAIQAFEKLKKTPIDAKNVAQKRAELEVIIKMFKDIEDSYISDGIEPIEDFLKSRDAITAYKTELIAQDKEENEVKKATISLKSISSKKRVNAVGIILGLLVGGAFAKYWYSVAGKTMPSREELRVYAVGELDRVERARVDRNYLAERKQDLEIIIKMFQEIKDNKDNEDIACGIIACLDDDANYIRAKGLLRGTNVLIREQGIPEDLQV